MHVRLWPALLATVLLQCSGNSSARSTAATSSLVCYKLTFALWRASPDSTFAAAPFGMIGPMPDTVAFERSLAARDTTFARLPSTTGWILMLRLVGRDEPRAGSAWLARPEASDVGGLPAPSTTVTAVSVVCPRFPMVLGP